MRLIYVIVIAAASTKATEVAALRGRQERDQALTDIGTLIDCDRASTGLVLEGEGS